jgi:hypothetical protein
MLGRDPRRSRIAPGGGPPFQARKQEAALTAIAYALSRAAQAVQSVDELDCLKLIAIFCGIGLLVSLMAATYGLDLSPGFF